MLQPLFQVKLEPPFEDQGETILHPCHVVISSTSLNNFFAETPSSTDVGCLIVDKCSFSDNIFVSVRCLPSSEVEDSEYLRLHVSKEFLKHYKLRYGLRTSFKFVEGLPLSRVVFGAIDDNAFEWAGSLTWREKLLLTTCCRRTLCREKDYLLADPEGFELKDAKLNFGLFCFICEPVRQGILRSDTSVTVFNVRDKAIREALNWETKFALSPSLANFTDGTIFADIRILSQFHQVHQDALLELDGIVDPLNTVFIARDIFNQFGISPGFYVHVKLINEEQNISNIGNELFRLVNVCPTDLRHENDDDDITVYISPHLWFNLNHHPSTLFQPKTRMMFDLSKDVKHPCHAEEVYLAIVQSPYYNTNINTSAILKAYFKKTRYICKGDIIGINTKDVPEFLQSNRDLDYVITQPLIYFRVSSIESLGSTSGYLIDDEYTRLYQSGTAQSYIPAVMDTFYQDRSSFFSSPNPMGLDGVIEWMEAHIQPAFDMQNRLKLEVNSNILLTGPSGSGKTLAVKALCKRHNLHFHQVNCDELFGEGSHIIEARLKILFDNVSVYAPCIMLLRGIDLLGREKELKGENSRVVSTLCELLRNINKLETEWPIIIIATSTQSKLLNEDLTSVFLHPIHISPPNEEERKSILLDLTETILTSHDVSIEFLAQRTAGFILSDISNLVTEAVKNCQIRLHNSLLPSKNYQLEEDIVLAGFPVLQQDFVSALDKLQSNFAQTSGAPKIPKVSWEDVGGLEYVKQEILDTIQLPLDHPEILSTGLRRSGVLLYGPPGTGKTLIAKAVATECSLNFMSVKGPELINMYVGQSEGNVREVFEQARAAVPCIIFFDELDSLAPNRGRSGDSGGVMDRVVSQLLSEIDGLNNSSQVFVIGATNRPDLIDPALLRPGRFDRLVYVGIAQDKNSRLSILRALTRKLKLNPDLILEDIVESCPPNMSGADFYSLCSDAMMTRVQKNVQLVEKGILNIENADITIHKEDFDAAISKLVPSVSTDDLIKYKVIQQKF